MPTLRSELWRRFAPRWSSSPWPTSTWVGPLGLLILGAAMVLAMGVSQLGAGALELAVLVAAMTGVAGVATVRPVVALAALGFSCATLPYLERAGISYGANNLQGL